MEKIFFTTISYYISKHLTMAYSKVILIDSGRTLLFTKNPRESPIEFFTRIENRLGGIDILNINDQIKENSKDKFLYVGDKDIHLPKDSITLNKWKSESSEVEWISDAYSVLSPDAMKTEENKIIDDIHIYLGGEGIISRGGNNYKTSSITDGNCSLPVINQIIMI